MLESDGHWMTKLFRGKSERRPDSRMEQRIKLRFRSAGDRWRAGVTSDISFGGMYISCKRVPDGPDVEIKLAHGRTQLVLKGKVLRSGSMPTEFAPQGFTVKLVGQPESWLGLCRRLRERFSRRRRTTELTVSAPDAD